MDSWDQAPAASELETLVAGALAREIYGDGETRPGSLEPGEPDEHRLRGEGRLPGGHGLPGESRLSGEGCVSGGHGLSGESGLFGESCLPGESCLSGEGRLSGGHGLPGEGRLPGGHGLPGEGRLPGGHGLPGEGRLPGEHGLPGESRLPGPSRQAAEPRKTAARDLPGAPDSLITTGGTESNQLALLLAREVYGGSVRLVCGANAHHSLARAAWLLGLPEPAVVPAPAGTLDPTALDETLTRLPGPLLVAATAGTTDAGLIDPLPEIAARCAAHGARLHIDAAYGGGLLFSTRHRAALTGLDAADTVTLDLHKLGWQPIAAGLLAVKNPRDLTALRQRADYLNAADDTEAGLPDLLGRSLRTTRRPDVLKLAVTLKTLGRSGLGTLVDQVCARARELAALVHDHPGFALHAPPAISTVLFRPAGATDATVAAVRRALLTDGRAVLGRTRLDGRLWLKATLLNPATGPDDLAALLHLVAARRATLVEGHTPR
ncbi:pyridoxal phosphate-dependent decarboxylase family protein [Streptomyces violaceus]|uniref:pyridoxal phosphate-dependent decarboxylase family protein n=1 Tax=Streptomyces violaceus TaxID=1936 RepID=UPI00399D63CA